MVHISLHGTVATQRDDFRRTIVTPKETLELDLSGTETLGHVTNDIWTPVQRCRLFPLLGLSWREK